MFDGASIAMLVTMTIAYVLPAVYQRVPIVGPVIVAPDHCYHGPTPQVHMHTGRERPAGTPLCSIRSCVLTAHAGNPADVQQYRPVKILRPKFRGQKHRELCTSVMTSEVHLCIGCACSAGQQCRCSCRSSITKNGSTTTSGHRISAQQSRSECLLGQCLALCRKQTMANQAASSHHNQQSALLLFHSIARSSRRQQLDHFDPSAMIGLHAYGATPAICTDSLLGPPDCVAGQKSAVASA